MKREQIPKRKKVAAITASRKKKRTVTKENQVDQPLLKRMIFGEEKPDLTELEAGSTTILDILAPAAVDTKSKDYIIVDGVYHAYLYITGYRSFRRCLLRCPLCLPGYRAHGGQ